ncbi:hypothetical protein F8388_013771 [Cannabis sativa]|uniref:Uncharacterized protein n=1 Tax=Cannabis sativa TaxID=3483 RepID=A0A7J6DSB1_CANSA|nr:hypothetical protein G4B88_000514 [Cannabis sativa]KAF4349221.1 hypothetical protein F8388_021789 [Cannabis sativa]KAF4364740.1 hypothetical protein F8388_013771 [Cannabis sativa]
MEYVVKTKAVLTINSFEKGGDGGGPSECDNNYHSDDTPVVALSTGWFNNMQRCLQNITIYGNGRSVSAMVVDECDSTAGCDADHDYQPPCPNNIVDASKAVWKALGVSKATESFNKFGCGQYDPIWRTQLLALGLEQDGRVEGDFDAYSLGTSI